MEWKELDIEKKLLVANAITIYQQYKSVSISLLGGVLKIPTSSVIGLNSKPSISFKLENSCYYYAYINSNPTKEILNGHGIEIDKFCNYLGLNDEAREPVVEAEDALLNRQYKWAYKDYFEMLLVDFKREVSKTYGINGNIPFDLTVENIIASLFRREPAISDLFSKMGSSDTIDKVLEKMGKHMYDEDIDYVELPKEEQYILSQPVSNR